MDEELETAGEEEEETQEEWYLDGSEAEEYKGYLIVVQPDTDLENPRKTSEELGTFVAFGKYSHLSDNELQSTSMLEYMRDVVRPQAALVLRVYALDHGCLRLKVGETDPFSHLYYGFDSGLLGYIWVSKERVRKEYGKKRISKRTLEIVRRVLVSEIDELDAWVNGEIYMFNIYKDGELIEGDSWYYDEDLAHTNAHRTVDILVENQEKEASSERGN